MPIFLLLFAIGLWVEGRPVTYTWRERLVFDMTVFDLETSEYTVLLIVLGFKEVVVGGAELQHSPCL